MKKVINVFRVIINQIRFVCLSLFVNVKCKGKCTSRLDNEWRIDKESTLSIGYHFSSLKNCRFLVRKGTLIIGDGVGLNTNCIVACHKRIEIKEGVEIGPNVCIYDHDHDFKCKGGIKEKKYICDEVIIGKNTWIGANSIILKGSVIGDNCVIAAGSVVSGTIPSDTVFVQKRAGSIIEYEKN